MTAKTGYFYRFPTEAEWEYACLVGTSSAYYYRNNSDYLEWYAWYKDNSKEKYHKIGEKKPNKWGLYDMMENVADWTMDYNKKDYYEKLKLKKRSANQSTISPQTTLYAFIAWRIMGRSGRPTTLC